MNAQELINTINDARSIFVLSNGIVPHYLTMNYQTKNILTNSITEIFGMKILIDDKLADNEFRILKEK